MDGLSWRIPLKWMIWAGPTVPTTITSQSEVVQQPTPGKFYEGETTSALTLVTPKRRFAAWFLRTTHWRIFFRTSAEQLGIARAGIPKISGIPVPQTAKNPGGHSTAPGVQDRPSEAGGKAVGA